MPRTVKRQIVVGPDVDLKREIVRDRNGVRVTEEYIESAIRDVHAALERRAGRPALGEPGTRAPALAVRLPLALKTELDERARDEGRRPSDLVREAVRQYLQPDKRRPTRRVPPG
jgi:Ribbon-helix-helix protein, copG family